jgi:cytochrome c oxidase assembly factor CtaG
MIDLLKFRQLLGEAGKLMTDEEVERVRAIEYGFADAIFEIWLRKRNAQVNARLKAPDTL